MIKKISAILLALVLCLSVVVVPASAYELGSGSEIAYEVKLDKEYYSAGETVTISLYLYGASGLEFGTGAICFGVNSALFDIDENPNADVKESAVGSELNESYYKAANGSTWAWQTNATILNNIKTYNTPEENELFDQYMKYTIARNTSGTHDNATSNKNGLPADEISADSENGVPFVSFQLKLRDDIEDGVVVNVGVPTGPMPKNYTYMNYYKNPGSATTVVKTTAATSEVVFSTNATIGEPAPELPMLTLANANREQIKFDKNGTAYAGTFAYRAFVELDNFDTVFESVADATDLTDGDGILEAGYLVNKGAIDEAKAKDQVENGTVTYTQDDKAYISTNYISGKYVMACTITGIPDADKGEVLGALAYVKFMQGGKEYYAYYTVKTGTFEGLYNTYYGQAFPA